MAPLPAAEAVAPLPAAEAVAPLPAAEAVAPLPAAEAGATLGSVTRLEVKHEFGREDIAAITRLLDLATEVDGHAPLGEHRWLDLVQGGRQRPERPDRAGSTGPERPDRAGSTGPERPDRAGSTGPERPDRAGSTGPERPDRAGSTGFVGLVAEEDGNDHLVGYAQVTRDHADHARPGARPGRDASWAVEFVVDPYHRDAMPGIGQSLVEAALDVVRGEGGGHVHLWVPKPGPPHDQIAAAVGLRQGRELRQLRRPLPLGPVGGAAGIEVRPFRPGEDEEAWLYVNNRAFRWHPEQGGWDLETLRSREGQPWFDPSGFLLHERDGRLAGFCWTKIHPDSHPPLGEIYVIAVDPDFQGLGLGRSLTVAGLEWLSARGLGVAMLYVDGDNAAALRLYEGLGFTVDHVDRAYVGDVGPATPQTTPPSSPTSEPTP